MLKKLAFITAALIAPATMASAESSLVFTGGSITSDTHYSYLGGVTALNRDLGKDGFLLRASGALGSYEYKKEVFSRPSTPPFFSVTNDDIDGDVSSGDLMVGYQKFLNGNRFTLYLGGEYQEHDLSPSDNRNPVSGSETALKVQAETSINVIDKVKLDAMGSYSGAFDSYWSKAQLGYNICSSISVGPEIAFMGSESYDQQRYGTFIKDIPLGPAKGSASTGYANSSYTGGKNSAYGEVGISLAF